jgi:antitoxin PrlF
MPVAKLTSKGQITIPREIREHLRLKPGDRVQFRVEGEAVAVSKAGDLGELAGAVEVPPRLRGRRWEEIRRAAHREWALRSEVRGRHDAG